MTIKKERLSAKAEFDQFSIGYSGGMENRLKQAVGKDLDQFIDIKVRRLVRELFPVGLMRNQTSLLDFGCGTGEFLRSMNRHGFRGTMEGWDVSSEMLREAARRWQGSNLPALHCIDPELKSFPDKRFDIVILCCVLHHVAKAKRQELLQAVSKILAPGGWLVIFEHNPWNPVTNWVVHHTEIDRNAILLRPHEVRLLIRSAGLISRKLDYFLFFPPRLKWLERTERMLSWLPLGGQFSVIAEKPV
jgi:SAM-dependent methyltransferase